MEEILFNKCQTPMRDLELEKYPKGVTDTRKYCVYKHTSPSGKTYIGITKLSLHQRWKKDGSGYKYCKLFNRAIQKYGWDNIKHEIVLKDVSESEAYYTEKYLIRWYKIHNLSYNIADGGEGAVGCVMPEEARKKISKFLSETRGKAVLQYNLKGEFIREFRSAQEASRILKLGKTSVSNCASGIKRENTLHGYIFIYKDDVGTLPRRLRLCSKHWRKYKIVQYKGSEVVNTFDSIREAERVTGVNRVCIRKNINGVFIRAGRYTWKKVMEEDLYGNAI